MGSFNYQFFMLHIAWLQIVNPQEINTADCGLSFGCFKNPSSCTSLSNCNWLITYVYNTTTNRLDVSIGGKDKWIAFGLNDKISMDGTSGHVCMNNGGVLSLREFRNSGYSPSFMNVVGLKDDQLKSSPNLLCRFSRPLTAPAGSSMKSLDKKWYLIAAHGNSFDTSNVPSQHSSSDRGPSSGKINLTAISTAYDIGKPCYGQASPISDNSTGQRICCGRCSNRKECPSGSFCHIHAADAFAVCCPNSVQPPTQQPATATVQSTSSSIQQPTTETICGTTVCTFGSQCITHPNGNKTCECHMCKAAYDPVCGSDNKTYPNECHMGMTSCREKRTITLKYRGSCEIICGTTVCTFGSQCITHPNGNKTCECHMCKAAYDPVCGSDNKTYPNECHMGMTSCREKRTITLKYRGSCGMTCGTTVCTYGSQCITHPNGNKTCECHMCKSAHDPVCGSDDKTYPNECHMGMISCREKRTITLKYRGSCGTSAAETIAISTRYPLGLAFVIAFRLIL